MLKIKFENAEVFKSLEQNAFDGQLNYDDFPPDEYKYFSRLSKIGYNSRHRGWSADICNDKKREILNDYRKSKEKSDRFYKMACVMQDNIRRGGTTISDLYKATTIEDKLHYALQVIELITCEEGLEARNMQILRNNAKEVQDEHRH